MEYIIIKYISAHLKLLRKEINAKRKRYDRLAAISGYSKFFRVFTF